nr:hypothetical protein [Streptomyces sp. MH191]
MRSPKAWTRGSRYGSGDGDPWGPAWGSGPGVSRSMAVEPSEPVGEGGPAGGRPDRGVKSASMPGTKVCRCGGGVVKASVSGAGTGEGEDVRDEVGARRSARLDVATDGALGSVTGVGTDGALGSVTGVGTDGAGGPPRGVGAGSRAACVPGASVSGTGGSETCGSEACGSRVCVPGAYVPGACVPGACVPGAARSSRVGAGSVG